MICRFDRVAFGVIAAVLDGILCQVVATRTSPGYGFLSPVELITGLACLGPDPTQAIDVARCELPVPESRRPQRNPSSAS
jgi:hypothetical protein